MLRGKAIHCKVYGHSAVICAKTAEPIDVPFGLWARMGPINHWAILEDRGAHC